MRKVKVNPLLLSEEVTEPKHLMREDKVCFLSVGCSVGRRSVRFKMEGV